MVAAAKAVDGLGHPTIRSTSSSWSRMRGSGSMGNSQLVNHDSIIEILLLLSEQEQMAIAFCTVLCDWHHRSRLRNQNPPKNQQLSDELT